MIPQIIAAATALLALSGHPDASLLKQYADSARVPVEIVWAVAEIESGHRANNLARGAAGEIGRFQLKAFWSNSFRSVCGNAPVEDYKSNLCRGSFLLAYCHRRSGSWHSAIACYNGRGPRAEAYVKRVEAVLGRIYLKELGNVEHS